MFSRLHQAPSLTQQVSTVLWLSFLVAGVATGVFFSLIDPVEISACVAMPELSHIAAYSIGFLFFWLLTSITSFLSLFFLGVEKNE